MSISLKGYTTAIFFVAPQKLNSVIKFVLLVQALRVRFKQNIWTENIIKKTLKLDWVTPAPLTSFIEVSLFIYL